MNLFSTDVTRLWIEVWETGSQTAISEQPPQIAVKVYCTGRYSSDLYSYIIICLLYDHILRFYSSSVGRDESQIPRGLWPKNTRLQITPIYLTIGFSRGTRFITPLLTTSLSSTTASQTKHAMHCSRHCATTIGIAGGISAMVQWVHWQPIQIESIPNTFVCDFLDILERLGHHQFNFLVGSTNKELYCIPDVPVDVSGMQADLVHVGVRRVERFPPRMAHLHQGCAERARVFQ